MLLIHIAADAAAAAPRIAANAAAYAAAAAAPLFQIQITVDALAYVVDPDRC